MSDPYNMREAQAGLAKLCRSGKRFVIANRNRPVVVGMPIAGVNFALWASHRTVIVASGRPKGLTDCGKL